MTKIDKFFLFLWVVLGLTAMTVAIIAAMAHAWLSMIMDIGIFGYSLFNYLYDRAVYEREAMKNDYDFYN